MFCDDILTYWEAFCQLISENILKIGTFDKKAMYNLYK